ncbi:ferritin-like domain-containing protein [Hymenobacter sp.]|jgi:hypothetical protein|uniref:ferritin-like domain-containing protein n=1 Tax=Hymenobacter sp. TaxID=1898978 RepID=UPI002ED77438
MSKLLPPPEPATQPTSHSTSRRSFLRYTGASMAVGGLLLAGCDDDNENDNRIDVGSGDNGVLNYAYALEQLETAFYAAVKGGAYYAGASAAEKQIFDDLSLHEQAHTNFLKAALSTNAIKQLEADFSTINFADKTSVLTAARSFEDLGVAAYNGAGRFITSAVYLVAAGKIVSVEARHAALIRDLISYNKFVDNDVVNLFIPTDPSVPGGPGNEGTGLERSKRPAEVLNTANQFLKEGSKLSANSLV